MYRGARALSVVETVRTRSNGCSGPQARGPACKGPRTQTGQALGLPSPVPVLIVQTYAVAVEQVEAVDHSRRPPPFRPLTHQPWFALALSGSSPAAAGTASFPRSRGFRGLDFAYFFEPRCLVCHPVSPFSPSPVLPSPFQNIQNLIYQITFLRLEFLY